MNDMKMKWWMSLINTVSDSTINLIWLLVFAPGVCNGCDNGDNDSTDKRTYLDTQWWLVGVAAYSLIQLLYLYLLVSPSTVTTQSLHAVVSRSTHTKSNTEEGTLMESHFWTCAKILMACLQLWIPLFLLDEVTARVYKFFFSFIWIQNVSTRYFSKRATVSECLCVRVCVCVCVGMASRTHSPAFRGRPRYTAPRRLAGSLRKSKQENHVTTLVMKEP